MIFSEAVDGSRDAVLHDSRTEVQQKTELHVGEPQVSQELLLMGVVGRFHGLQFHNDLALSYDIGAKSLIESDSMRSAPTPRVIVLSLLRQFELLPRRSCIAPANRWPSNSEDSACAFVQWCRCRMDNEAVRG